MKRRAKQQSDANPSFKGFHIQPKNKKQDLLIRSIKEFSISVAIGPAGTGKTYISAMTLAQLFCTGKYNKIVLTRANVPTGRSLGFFPGDIKEKLTPWLNPMLNVFKKAFGEKYDYLLARDIIELQPLETVRGMSYEDCLIMVDEAQNLNFDEIKALTTRLGEGSKLVLSGDQSQSDVENGKSLMKFVSLCEKHNIEIPIVEFSVEDIVRSDIVAQLVKMYMTVK